MCVCFQRRCRHLFSAATCASQCTLRRSRANAWLSAWLYCLNMITGDVDHWRPHSTDILWRSLRFLCKDTVEGKIAELQKRKMALAHNVLTGYVASYNVLTGYVASYNVLTGYVTSYNVRTGYVTSYNVLTVYVASYNVLTGYVTSYNVLIGYVTSYNVLTGYVTSYNVLTGYVTSCNVLMKKIFSKCFWFFVSISWFWLSRHVQLLSRYGPVSNS